MQGAKQSAGTRRHGRATPPRPGSERPNRYERPRRARPESRRADHAGWPAPRRVRRQRLRHHGAARAFPHPAVRHDEAGVVEQARLGVGRRVGQAAQQRLGDRFDIKRFHAVLKDGAMPLSIMERLVKERVA